MLFHSINFLFVFLPVVWVGFMLLSHLRCVNAAILWLVVGSLFFYGFHVPQYVFLILGSVGANFIIGRCILMRRSRHIVAVGVALNLGLLGYFKYSGFLVENLNAATGGLLPVPEIVLPIGISFFTFQQIAYIIDVYRTGGRRYRPLEYGFFVVFFPQLIAGPIIHHYEILPQLSRLKFRWRRVGMDLSVGFTIFAIGLCKKLFIADSVGVVVDTVYSPDYTLSFFDCWYGTLAYAFQIYFDFSAYSDMATGLARMFGLKLPINFYSPYKSTSIVDFWRSWHMTLSRFLRDYLYIPMGGGRSGGWRASANVMIVMLLGGLWHGAGWGFLLWGGLHGTFILINHGWRKVRVPFDKNAPVYRLATWLLTFVAVVVAWVPFRSPDIQMTMLFYQEMFGFNGLNLGFARFLVWGDLYAVISNLGINLASSEVTTNVRIWIVIAAGIAFLAPNTYQYMWRVEPALGYFRKAKIPAILRWRPNACVGLVLGALAAMAIVSQSRTIQFLYFQF